MTAETVQQDMLDSIEIMKNAGLSREEMLTIVTAITRMVVFEATHREESDGSISV